MDYDLFEQLYADLTQDLLSYGLFLSKDHHLAEELVSDAFYKFFITEPTLPTKQIKYWLMRVMKNSYLDGLRKNKRMIAIADTAFFDSQLEVMAPTEMIDHVIKQEKQKAVFNQLDSLPPKYREVMFLHYYLDLTIAEIMNVLHLQNGQVRTILYRGRRLLRERMGEKND